MIKEDIENLLIGFDEEDREYFLKFYALMEQILLKGKEGILSSEKYTTKDSIYNLSGLIKDEMLEEYYLYEHMQNLKKIISRSKKLRISFVQKIPSEKVMNYIEEASKCYLYGFFQACIVLCRVIIEQSLHDKLEEKTGIPDSRRLLDAIDEATAHKILRRDLAIKAHEIRKRAIKCLHISKREEDEHGAFDSLKKTKIILEYIYR